MFICCAAEPKADEGAVVERAVVTLATNNDGASPAKTPTDLMDAPAIPALSDTRVASESAPAAEEEAKPDEADVLPPPPELAEAAPPAAPPAPVGEYFGTVAWCNGECDGCKARIEKGSAVDISYEGPKEQWRCPVCSGGQASEDAQKCSAEWTQATANGQIPLTFMVDKKPKTVYASRRPLSLVFRNEIPIVVDKVDGHAKELGIEPSWIFTAIDGRIAGDEFHGFFCDFVETMNRLPGNYSLPLLFELPDGKKKTIVVPTKPLGLVFEKSLPAITNQANNLAATLGVEVGWKLLRFADKNVGEYETFDSFFETFKASIAKVPEKKG